MYTIGQVSEMFDIPVSTLRYYDKEGLFPNLKRAGSIRQFDEDELELLRIIDCLKKTGLEIKDIKKFVSMVQEGPASYADRKALFEARRAQAEEEIARLQTKLERLEFGCWYYETALHDGDEDRLKAMLRDGLPEGIQELYDEAHS